MLEADEFEIERYRKAFQVAHEKAEAAELQLNSVKAALNEQKGELKVYKEIVDILVNKLAEIRDNKY